jgi:hypothetical protein
VKLLDGGRGPHCLNSGMGMKRGIFFLRYLLGGSNSIKHRDLLLAILGCDQRMLEVVLRLFERYETEFGGNILHKVIKDLDETEGRFHFENFILDILLNVLDEINKKYKLDFNSSCLEHTELSYEFALPYLEEILHEMGFAPSQVTKIISEFHSWKVVMHQRSIF